MSTNKTKRPAFQSVELDPIDVRLEAKAIEKGIPTLVNGKPDGSTAGKPESSPPAEVSASADVYHNYNVEIVSRGLSQPLKVDLPDYVWVALKIRCAQERISMRYFTMSAFRAQGIEINDIDMHEDGRKLRGAKARQSDN